MNINISVNLIAHSYIDASAMEAGPTESWDSWLISSNKELAEFFDESSGDDCNFITLFQEICLEGKDDENHKPFMTLKRVKLKSGKYIWKFISEPEAAPKSVVEPCSCGAKGCTAK